MPKVIFDYEACIGTGECVEVCPVEVLELSKNENWCKAVDGEVDNEEAVEQFYDEVDQEKPPVDVVIEYDIPGCVACMSCEVSCPEEAITVEE